MTARDFVVLTRRENRELERIEAMPWRNERVIARALFVDKIERRQRRRQVVSSALMVVAVLGICVAVLGIIMAVGAITNGDFRNPLVP